MVKNGEGILVRRKALLVRCIDDANANLLNDFSTHWFEQHPDDTIGTQCLGAGASRISVVDALLPTPIGGLGISRARGLSIPLCGLGAIRGCSSPIFQTLRVQEHAFRVAPARALGEQLHRTFGILGDALPPQVHGTQISTGGH